MGSAFCVLVAAVSAAQAGEPEKITRVVDYEVSVAADGRLAFISNRSGQMKLHVSAEDGSNPRQLSNSPGTHDNPAWSPDGRFIAFATEHDGNSDIYVIGADGTGLHRLSSSPGADIHPAWSPDGKRLLFTTLRNSRSADNPQLDIYLLELSSGEERRITSGPIASYASWSPDGTKMAYWQMFHGNAEIVLADASGRFVRRLTNNPAFDGWPSWSPDGASIAFARERGDDADIYMIELDGTERLVAGGTGRKTGPRWSPDGQSIYFSKREQGEVRIWRTKVTPKP